MLTLSKWIWIVDTELKYGTSVSYPLTHVLSAQALKNNLYLI